MGPRTSNRKVGATKVRRRATPSTAEVSIVDDGSMMQNGRVPREKEIAKAKPRRQITTSATKEDDEEFLLEENGGDENEETEAKTTG